MTTPEPLLARAMDAYRTCEFVTLGRDGTPLAWPTAVHRRDDGTFLVTTSLAFARKALNVRRDGRVALLFSDPTASGLDEAPQMFVGGTAVCPEDIVTSPAGDEAYWSMLFDRQPDSRRYVDAPARWLMDWYYLRLHITVTPTRIEARPPLAELTRDAGSGEPFASALPGAAVLARFASAVLAARDDSGAPVLMRVRPRPADEGYLIEATADEPIAAGPASLLVHRHDEHLSGLYNAVVRGELKPMVDGRWLFVPGRVIEPSGDGGTAALLRTLRTARRDTNAYLERRNLPRPRVDWAALRTLARASAARTPKS